MTRCITLSFAPVLRLQIRKPDLFQFLFQRVLFRVRRLPRWLIGTRIRVLWNGLSVPRGIHVCWTRELGNRRREMRLRLREWLILILNLKAIRDRSRCSHWGSLDSHRWRHIRGLESGGHHRRIQFFAVTKLPSKTVAAVESRKLRRVIAAA